MAFKPYPSMVISKRSEIIAHNAHVKTRQVLRRRALNRGMSASQWRQLLAQPNQ